MIGDRTYPWGWRQSGGSLRWKNVFQHIFAYTEKAKKLIAAETISVLAATATAVTAKTVSSGLTNPDGIRNLQIGFSGTTADILAGTLVVNGTNAEGKAISENFTVGAAQSATLVGNKAFRTVTSVVFPAASSANANISVGVGNKLGLHHRLVPNRTSMAVVYGSSTADGSANNPTLDAAPTASNVDTQLVELNTVTPATLPDGTKFYTIFYWFHKFLVGAVNDQSDFYSTTTSTSTSSTSTSTSTSSTSTSISTSSTSTSSTSSSTSSTSTSTTTTP